MSFGHETDKREEKMQLESKKAIVTGGARGIGRAIVEEFCKEAAEVVFCDISREDGDRTEQDLRQHGYCAHFVYADLGDSEDICNMIKQAVLICGRIDILVNNAGVLCEDALAENIDENEWERLIRIDLTAPFLCSKFALPYLRQSKGCIVNIASAAALTASRNDPPYCAAKHGVLGLTRSIACDYAPYRVRANAICPGTCETEMWKNYLATLSPEEASRKQNHYLEVQPLGMCHPEDVAYAAVFLASDRARFITGIALPVDGGFTAI